MADHFTLLLPFDLTRSFSLARVIAEDPTITPRDAHPLHEQFDVSGPERRFALTLLRAKTNLWLFRCNKTLFCGDFVIVDMSASSAEAGRAVHVVELKMGEAVRPGGGVQLRRWREAVEEIARKHGVVPASVEAALIRGGEDEVLAHLGVVPV